MNKKTVLITGASSGIGEATAKWLKKEGYIVYGAARRLEKMQKELEPLGINVIKLDLSNEKSILSCIKTIIEKEGQIDILINNASYLNFGTIEETPLDIGKKHYEVNIFGLAYITQLVIPYMRDNKYGKIVNISSTGGKSAGPFGGWYQSSKFALEGMSDVMRIELKQFGIDVIVIEPGAIKTSMVSEIADSLLRNSGNGLYKKSANKFADAIQNMIKDATPPDEIAKTITNAIQTKYPKTRYVKGKRAKTFLIAKRFLPDKFFDKMIIREFF